MVDAISRNGSRDSRFTATTITTTEWVTVSVCLRVHNRSVEMGDKVLCCLVNLSQVFCLSVGSMSGTALLESRAAFVPDMLPTREESSSAGVIYCARGSVWVA